ncbi:unnamed protein product (macronuclear) [Paramecium tetraurelia]|uniref:F-box/LRR-repeat protein 15-like leucin rich repeat domain-containing protein n=1 Tax=Paramecium tetraurelia TaxID=5888 RepID=A0DRX6_PARTE|nr:uncharacterized protein GSPATT00019497001 [Paramecium tetraurelia]CAK85793.1 unnamed protein product [Paramecium tetraurelia]|eukprot:XP_001453190.1 hypothetical protein (macronuclear) [Paramecium tetraurelia strain d4-2]
MKNDKEFSIKETVNKNIERVQFPAFNQHSSLLGWCSMNYPRVLQNPQFMPKPKPKEYDDNLDFLYQKRKKEQQNNQLIKPFTNYQLTKEAVILEDIGAPPPGFKKTLKQLTTANPESKALIYNQTYKDYDPYLNIKPINSQFKQEQNENFTRTIRQVGDVVYNQTYENEDIRHLKKLPNSILSEQNLQEALNPKLKFLNLHNHTWLKMEQISKIGYFAINLEELVLSNTELEDDILMELAKSCRNLKVIDVSSCPKLTETGIRNFLDYTSKYLQGFKCASNLQSITDYSLEPLQNAPFLSIVNISFCNNLTSNFTKYLLQSGCRLKELQIATVENLQADLLSDLISRSKVDMEYLDLSFIPTKDISDSVISATSLCTNIHTLILSGSTNISDSSVGRLSSLHKLKQLKLGGIQYLADNTLVYIAQSCNKLEMLELNNCSKLGEQGLEGILKALPHLQVISINFTPEIQDPFLQEKRNEYPKVNIIRTINKMTDPKDDGLRMPLPLESVVMQRPKKKKKK